jgi:hypothetical protein
VIDATGWTEKQIQDYLELEELGLLKDGKLTEEGRALLGRTGYFPQVTNINNDPRFRR